MPGGGFVPQGIRLVEDLDGNGTADAGEPVAAPTTAITLAPGASINLLLVGTVPVGVATGASVDFTLTAQSPDGSVTKTATARLVQGNAATIVVTTVATPTAPVQGGTLNASITARADLPITGTTITVDGIPKPLVLLRATVPANTSLVSAVASDGAVVLYHRRNDPPDQYFTAPGPLATVDGIAFATATLAGGASLSGNVVVAIASNASGTITNGVTLTYDEQGLDRSVAGSALSVPLPSIASVLSFYGSDGLCPSGPPSCSPEARCTCSSMRAAATPIPTFARRSRSS